MKVEQPCVLLAVSSYSFRNDSNEQIEGTTVTVGFDHPKDRLIGYDIKQFKTKDVTLYARVRKEHIGKDVIIVGELDMTGKAPKIVPLEIKLPGAAGGKAAA